MKPRRKLLLLLRRLVRWQRLGRKLLLRGRGLIRLWWWHRLVLLLLWWGSILLIGWLAGWWLRKKCFLHFSSPDKKECGVFTKANDVALRDIGLLCWLLVYGHDILGRKFLDTPQA